MARIFLRTCILLLTLTLLPQVMAANVALVLSDVSGPYAEFATSFAEYSSKSHWKVSYSGKIEGLSGATSRPELIVTAGSEAFRSALALGGNTPILATLIPRNGYEKILAESGRNRSRGSTSAIYLDQPAARFASFVKKLLPGAQRVGLLISDETRPALATTRQSLGGLVIDSEDVASDSNLLDAANNLLPRVNLLLALPDSKIYKRDNIKSILVTSYRHQRPVIAFSKAFVNAGALAAIYSTPDQIARQASDLLNTLPGGISQLPPAQAPSLFAISINSAVAQSLNLDVPDEAVIRRSLQAEVNPR
jgi:putative ABC transport system substrate-binding protein